jgi:hypothetical protein
MSAIGAAVWVAKSYGLQVREPVLLRSTNNIVAWLCPSSIVAKVGVGHHPGFQREIRIASELSVLGGPVVTPAVELPAIVHSRDEFKITFWRYHPQPLELDFPARRIATALQRLHAAYAKISTDLRADLPSYLSELESVAELLRDERRMVALPEMNRLLLLRAFSRLKARMQELAPVGTHIVIHGSPHPYNILVVDSEPRFIDFETTSIGPLEWDLAHTPLDVEHGCAGTVNAELLRTCREMVNVKTAAWCWADVDRGDLREHAELHLARVKEYFTECER